MLLRARETRRYPDAGWWVAYALLLPVLVLGCRETPEPGTAPRGGAPSAPAASADPNAPIRLEYLCGNRFLITSKLPHPAQVTYAVGGSDERGEAVLPAAPNGDPPFTELEVVTVNDGPLELFVDGRSVATRANEGVSCAPGATGPAFAVAASSSAGRWTAPLSWPNVAVHLHLLRNGKVLSWGKFGQPYLWDPNTKTSTQVPAPSWLFCSGHAFLSDGRLLVAGGHISDDHGLPDANIFDPATSSWTRVAPMRYGRWYPTLTTLGNGQVVALAGSDETGKTVSVPEVWTGSGWRALTGAARALPYYPRTFLAPNGRLFYAGDEVATRYLNTSGSGSWSFVANRKYSASRDYGAAVMYEPGKILYAGGGRTTRTAEIIDLNQPSPTWQWTGSMAYARRHLNATVLPTGEVLVTGGTSGTGFNEPATAVHATEIWNPATGVWTTLASNAVDRAYHSTAVLLRDGRVLLAGSGDALLGTGEPAPDQRNAELFSPPYLFKGARPRITRAPGAASYGQTFFVETPDAAAITRVSLIRLGSTTHAFDENQRFLWLTFTGASGGLDLTAPDNRNHAPPGHYMLFVLNGNGVPSVARVIRLR